MDDLLLDTSASVALAVSDHPHHRTTIEALAGRRLGLAGHAAFETYSVLTRLPAPARRTPATIAHLLAVTFPGTRHLGARAARALLHELPSLGIAGGSVYDALVGAAAREHDLTLVTRDTRALETYRALGVSIHLLP
jgi:predicted nucleic acid-binding protein